MRLTQKNWVDIVSEMNRVIDEVYWKNNRELYLEKTQTKVLSLTHTIMDFCKLNKIHYTSVGLDDVPPSVCWQWEFVLPAYKKHKYKAEYSTVLCVSKLCNVFRIYNYYEMTDLNPDAMYPIIEGKGYEGGPATMLQDKLCLNIVEWLENLGYTCLMDYVADETVVGLENKARVLSAKRRGKTEPSESFFCSFSDVFFWLDFDDVRCLNFYYLKREYDKVQNIS